MSARWAGLLIAVAGLLGPATPLTGQSTHLLVVSGLGGAPGFSERFAEWAGSLVDAALDAGIPEGQVAWLAERPDVDDRVVGASRKEEVGAAIADLAGRAAPEDLVVIALFGHGSARGGEARINLPGPDLTAAELSAMLAPVPAKRVVVVNAASASGGFIGPLSGEGRVVITATRSARQNEATVFGGHFVDALSRGDTDKDGAVSLLEAFEYARREVAREYEAAGRLATETPLLDDNGDGEGSLEPGDSDGALAATITLARGRPVAAEGPDAPGPEVTRLLEERDRLRAALDAHRAREGSMPPAGYQAELDRLLLEIARVGRAIREAGGGDGGGGGPEGPRP